MVLVKRWIKVVVLGVNPILFRIKIIIGILIYLLFNKTPNYAYQSMISLFCLTGGRSNDHISRVIGFFNRPYIFSDANGVLGNMVGDKKEVVVSSLRSQGYYVFESLLPAELCDKLLNYATLHPCKVRSMDDDNLERSIATIYHREFPIAVRYDFETQDLLDNADIQNLLADISFAVIAQEYFGAKPVLDVLSMWWNTSFADKPDSEAAQFFHFDMDRPKWLKFFIYLTDVESTNGPHTFVAGSHKTGGIPPSMLRKGYARLTDEEVEAYYDRKDIIEFTAPRGTIIAEDTRGLHKGKHLKQGDRLILQIQFSNSLFGGCYPKANMDKELTERLKDAIERFPDLYSAYL